MPKLNVDRKITIDASPEKVRSIIADFHHWQHWSPWLISDPKAQVNVRADGKYYSWEGPRTGSGNMAITDETDTRISYDLNFLKPWKSSAKVAFEISDQGDQTDVSWLLDSSLPFFMFWMKKSMTAYLSSDYDRGLNMLKDYVEHGKVPSKLNFKGQSDFPGVSYVGIKRDCAIGDLNTAMTADFERLSSYAESQGDNVAGAPFSIYHKWDMVNQTAQYTAALPVKATPSDLPSGMGPGTIPPTKIYTVQHVGAYKHLGNAWTTLYNMQRGKEIKPVKNIHPFETYGNIPGEVPEEELLTDINFAIKG